MKDRYRKEKEPLSRDLTVGNEYKAILFFALPILIGNIFQQLYGVIDSVIVGRILGEEGLAAVGASFSISSIILAIAMGLTLGFGILISKYYGSKAYEKIQIVIDTGMIVTVAVAILIMFFSMVKCEELMNLFHVPDDIKKDAVLFLKILLIGTIPSFGYNSIANFLRGLGDSKTPLYFLIVSSIVNVVLDIIFVLTFSMGVAGAAFATVLAQYLCFILIIVYINKKHLQYRIQYKNLKFDLKALWEGLKIGLPAMLQQLFISFGNSVIQVLINSYGITVISAYTAASKIDGFATMPALNIGKAMSNYVAQNMGAGETKRARRGVKAGILMVAGITLLIAIPIFVFPQQLMSLFCDSNYVWEAGSLYLRIVSLFYIVFGAMQVLNGVLLGKGKAFISMIATIGSFCLLQVPAAILLSKWIGVIGIWIAAPIGWIGGFFIRYLYYRFAARDL